MTSVTAKGERPPAPKRVLVTEDQALIALAIGDELADAGCILIGPFATCVEAEAWLKDDTPDFAILDVELRDGPCTDVALDLKRRGIPFAVFSGSMQDEVPAVFADAPWYAKPSDLAELIAVLAAGGPVSDTGLAATG